MKEGLGRIATADDSDLAKKKPAERRSPSALTLPLPTMSVEDWLTSLRVNLERSKKQAERNKMLDVVLLQCLLVNYVRPGANCCRDRLQDCSVFFSKLIIAVHQRVVVEAEPDDLNVIQLAQKPK